jgi:hypothetical protein
MAWTHRMLGRIKKSLLVCRHRLDLLARMCSPIKEESSLAERVGPAEASENRGSGRPVVVDLHRFSCHHISSDAAFDILNADIAFRCNSILPSFSKQHKLLTHP